MHNYSPSPAQARPIRAGILGYTGYSGLELTGLLQRHPAVTPVLLDHRKAGDSSPDLLSPARISNQSQPLARLPWTPGVVSDNSLDVVFTATPPRGFHRGSAGGAGRGRAGH